MTKDKLINELIREGYLKTPAIIDAFRAIDRKDFLPEGMHRFAYLNEALPIGDRQTISQPLTVAFMLELLDPKPGEKILDVGAGSGWQTALLAHIVGEKGKIFAIERIIGLKDFAEKNIEKHGFISKGIVRLELGDATFGIPKEAPFDKIIAAASAEEIPLPWKEQVRLGGRIVAPLKRSVVVLYKISATEFDKREFFGFSFVPLIAGQQPKTY